MPFALCVAADEGYQISVDDLDALRSLQCQFRKCVVNSALAFLQERLQQYKLVEMKLLAQQSDLQASRSPVFKAMLENEMGESRSGIIKMSDMSFDALQAFVIFLCAEACLDEQMACELLVSAEKYQVEHLKSHCEKFLVSKLNWDNSIRYHVFAHQHNANILFEATLSLFMDNSHRLISHREFSEFLNKHPGLAVGICKVYIRKRLKDAEDTSAK